MQHRTFAVLSMGRDVLIEGCHNKLNAQGAFHQAQHGIMKIIRTSSDRDGVGCSAAADPEFCKHHGILNRMRTLSLHEVLVH